MTTGKLGGLSNIAAKLKTVAVKGTEIPEDSARIEEIALDLIDPNPNQPRKRFPENELNELAESIKQHGVMQPIVLKRKDDGRFEIIAGERRWRASKIAEKSTVRATIQKVSESAKQILALIENIQRQNLFSLDEADAVAALVEDLGGQQLAAEQLNKPKDYVSKMCKIHDLPGAAREAYESNLLGDDSEVLVNISRLHKMNPGFASMLVAFADKPGELTRRYVTEMVKRGKENQAPVSPQAWRDRDNKPEEPIKKASNKTFERTPTNDSKQISELSREVAGAPDIDADTSDPSYKYTVVPAANISIEVSIRSMRGKRAFLDLERISKDSKTVWVYDHDSHFFVEAADIAIIKVSRKA